MDTMMYASVAVIPWTIAEDRNHPVLREVEIVPFDLSIIKR